MTNVEIATELTLKAIECDKIRFDKHASSTLDEKEETNAFNAKQIIDFYNAIVNGIN